MTEVISDAYDIAHPTPVSLEKLSAIAVSLEIWRREVNEYRKSHTLASIVPRNLPIPLRTVLPGLPSVIYNIIDKYVRRFGVSLDIWVSDLSERGIFGSDERRRMNILEDFDDFVCDHYGAIHCVRTAERMMRCDRFDDATKFNIACTYFLEDDIRRMWPFVSKSMTIDSIDYYQYPHMYYWICRLTNQLDKITITRGNDTVEEVMIDRHWHHSVASLEYYWNGVSRENQVQKAFRVYGIDMKTFITIILPKLNDQQLDELVNKCDFDFSRLLFSALSIAEELVLGTWLYIRNIMNESKFKSLANVMISYQYCGINCGFKDNAKDHCADVVICRNRYAYLSREIWNSCPPNLKSSVIRDMLPGTDWLEDDYEDEGEEDEDEEDTGYFEFNHSHMNVELLLLILRCGSIKQRKSFWQNFWQQLLIESARGEDLQRIMVLCFETREHEMAAFKEIIARSGDVRRLCVRLLHEGEYFDHLNELVSFICPEMQNTRNFKQKILRECLILRPNYRLEPWIVRYAEKFNGFITSAYNDVDLSDVKNRLMPKIRIGLWNLIRDEQVSVKQLIKFIDSFVPTEETVVEMKMSIVDSFKKYVMNATAGRRREDIVDKPYFTSILLWCLGSDEEVDKFKLTCTL